VSVHRIEGEAHFAWVLEGRAMQDVWMMPSRSQERPRTDIMNSYGTTLRIWDPTLGAWRVTWFNPVTGTRDVQVGRHGDGTPIRWIFSEITPDSFRWTGEVLEGDGETWKLEAEFRAQRVKRG
jgi:hypothetical protein